MIKRETIDRIFETARIEEVVGDFVNLKKSGGNYKGLSPFSNEKTPSFMVSPAKQIFKDFSSGKGGNVVSFLMEYEHYTYPEALRFLAKKYNIEIEESQQTDEQKLLRSEKESLYLVNDFANSYFQEQLWKSEEGQNIGLSYFRERGMEKHIIEEFQLGYCPNSGTALTDAALSQSYQLEFLDKTGLTKVDGERKRDRFWGRVMFPILSHTGRVLGFGGRILKKDAKIAKYLNSPESEIYHKSKTLYGLYQAKNDLSRENECFLVEGYTDVISMYQSGIKNVVASSGTALTKDQINLIKRYTQNITMLYDGDPAGIKASLRGIDMILEEGMNVKVLLFPEGEDPDSYAKSHTTAELREFLKNEKQDFMRFKSSLLLKEAGDNPLEKSNAAREIVQSISIIPDALQRDAYIKECARILQMDERVLFSELAQIIRNKERQETRRNTRVTEEPAMEVVKPVDIPSQSLFYEQERQICWLLLNFGNAEIDRGKISDNEEKLESLPEEDQNLTIGEYILTELETDDIKFENPTFQKILDMYIQTFNKEERILVSDDFLRKEDTELIDTIVDLISEKYFLHNWEKKKIHPSSLADKVENDAVGSVLRYKEKKVGLLISHLRSELEESPEEREEKLQMMIDLTKLRTQLNLKLGRVV